jgi:hypothetical protein
VNNSPLRHLPHERSFSCFTRVLSSLALAATVCGCHYCPYNRHVLKPGQSCASDCIGNPFAGRPGRWRNGLACVDSNRHCPDCTNEQLESYYPAPETAPEAPTAEETPTDVAVEAPADVTVESPADVAVEKPQLEPLLQPFAPVENFPPPPTAATGDTPPMADPIAESPVPLFEGLVELNEIEAAPAEEPAIPDATLNSAEPSPAVTEQNEEPAPAKESQEENVDESPAASLFRLRLPPRLFRLREEEDVEIVDPPADPPIGPVSEASAEQGSNLFGGHSFGSPTQPASAPRFGHSLR